VDTEFALAIFALGLAFGSFLNVCIYRMPRDLSVIHPRSACPGCAQPISFYDNIPVLSWLILRGRCRHCKAPISPRYLMVELITGALFLACYAYFGPTLATLKYCTFGFLLVGLIFTDAETQLLPDKLTLPGLVAGLLFSLVVPVNDLLSKMLFGVIYQPASGASNPWLSLLQALMGAAVGASFLYGAGAIYLRARGVEGMGFGDVKMIAMIGSFLGLQATLLTLIAGSLLGSIVGLVGVAEEVAYGATKYGLRGLADGLRSEWARDAEGRRMTVTLVSPGVVDTPFFTRRNRGYQRSWPKPMPVSRVARLIVSSIEHRREDVVVPGWLLLAGRLNGGFPTLYRLLAQIPDRGRR